MSNSSIKSKTALLRNGETQKEMAIRKPMIIPPGFLKPCRPVWSFSIPNKSFPASTTWHARIYRSQDPSGHKITDIISIIHQEKDIFPELIARLKSSETDMEKLPIDTLIRSLETEGAILCQWVYHAVGDRTLFISIP